MDEHAICSTDRLILRHWLPSDYAAFAAINVDPEVMRFMPHPLSTEESDSLIKQIDMYFQIHGFGAYAVELRADHTFIGYIGLSTPSFQASFTPCVEIAWRLASNAWNRGLATEGARAVLKIAFERLHLNSIVSFTAEQNLASQRVMQKIGMKRDPSEDFEHPSLPPGHPLRRHVLYRLRAEDWLSAKNHREA
jgi:RimJ/RimL family protein N-acetyltransferase